MLDDLHNIKTEDFSGLVRTIHAYRGNYRVLAAMQHEIELAAMDKAGIHMELGSLFCFNRSGSMCSP